MNQNPTTFDELRFGYFDFAFGNVLKSIRGGTNPVGTMTLALCTVGALSEIEWSLNNLAMIDQTGGVVPMTQAQRSALGYVDSVMYQGWLDRWVRDTGINVSCASPMVYGVRSAFVHTAGDSLSLSKAGVKAWNITVNSPKTHYQVVEHTEPRFTLEMPDFVAETILASDRFFAYYRTLLDNAPLELSRRIRFLSGFAGSNSDGQVIQKFIPYHRSLEWFDERLSATPIEISKDALADQIRMFYMDCRDLVFQ